MRIALLSRNGDLYTHQRIIEEAQKRGHHIEVFNTLKCYMGIVDSKPAIHYSNGTVITGFDAIIPRIGASITFYGTAVVRHFEMMGVYSLNSSLAISRSRDKLRSLQHLTRKGIPMPDTAFAHSVMNTSDLIKMVGGAPLVIKLLEGTQGKGVVLTETKSASESVINAFKGLDANILVQQYIKEASGTDIRCFVIGGKVVATMQRKASEGEFRANIHCGGSASKVKITAKERNIAIKAAKTLGLRVAGVDILRSEKGPLVIEVNSSPGIEGIEKTTGKNIAGMIIQYLESKLTKKQKQEDV
jgi:ribosomal protein S6--L-glutamate ligase